MAKYPRIRDQHIAVFGGSGSGKTVLASSFFGPFQEKSLASDLWDLVADDIGQGTRLYRNYVGMRDHATAPSPTQFAGTTYYFSLKLKGAADAQAKKRPFDILRLAWHDYPGEWFEELPSSDEEANRRVDTFRSLLRSDVALILVDGQKLLDSKGEEERYLKLLLTNLRQGLLQLKDGLLAGEGRLVEFPDLDHRAIEGGSIPRLGRSLLPRLDHLESRRSHRQPPPDAARIRRNSGSAVTG
jgi:hypothetical protein